MYPLGAPPTRYVWVGGAPNWLSECSVPARRASAYTTFLKYCVHGESLRTTTCLENVVGGKQRHAP